MQSLYHYVDMFPRYAVGSVVGIGGMAGAVGGMMIARMVGEILQRTGSYVPIFIIAASAYLAALLVIHLLSPKLEPANLEATRQKKVFGHRLCMNRFDG